MLNYLERTRGCVRYRAPCPGVRAGVRETGMCRSVTGMCRSVTAHSACETSLFATRWSPLSAALIGCEMEKKATLDATSLFIKGASIVVSVSPLAMKASLGRQSCEPVALSPTRGAGWRQYGHLSPSRRQAGPVSPPYCAATVCWEPTSSTREESSYPGGGPLGDSTSAHRR